MQMLQQNKCLMYQSGQPAASDIHNILNRVNEEISMYNDFDIENVKIALPKVYEIFFSAKCLLKQPFSEKNNESEGSPDESCDDSDTSSDNESSTNMEGGDAKIETNNAV